MPSYGRYISGICTIPWLWRLDWNYLVRTLHQSARVTSSPQSPSSSSSIHVSGPSRYLSCYSSDVSAKMWSTKSSYGGLFLASQSQHISPVLVLYNIHASFGPLSTLLPTALRRRRYHFSRSRLSWIVLGMYSRIFWVGPIELAPWGCLLTYLLQSCWSLSLCYGGCKCKGLEKSLLLASFPLSSSPWYSQ